MIFYIKCHKWIELNVMVLHPWLWWFLALPALIGKWTETLTAAGHKCGGVYLLCLDLSGPAPSESLEQDSFQDLQAAVLILFTITGNLDDCVLEDLDKALWIRYQTLLKQSGGAFAQPFVCLTSCMESARQDLWYSMIEYSSAEEITKKKIMEYMIILKWINMFSKYKYMKRRTCFVSFSFIL